MQADLVSNMQKEFIYVYSFMMLCSYINFGRRGNLNPLGNITLLIWAHNSD